MKGIVRGVCGLTLALAAACTSDDTVEVGGDFDDVAVNREAMFVSIGDSSEVLVRLVNDLNTATPTSFTVSNVGAGIQVNYDAQYRPDYTSGELVAPVVKTQQRYWVVGTAIGLYEFTLTSSGASQVVRVYVTPDNLGAALSKSVGVVAGETLTITAPAGLMFNPTSAVTFTTGTAVVTSRAADGSTITFLVGPGVTGPATVTNVTKTYAPAAPVVTLQTTQTLAVPAVTVAPATISTAAPGTGATFTVALGGGLRFSNTAKVLIGGVESGIVALSADSSTATVVAALTATGAVTFTDLVLNFLPSVKISLPSDGKTVAPTATFAGQTLAGADAFATSPIITLPTVVGQSTVITDNGGAWGTPTGCTTTLGGDNCRVYQIVVPAGRTYTLTGMFDTNADIGYYRVNSTFGGAATIADALGQSATRTEAGTLGASLTAGTYYIMIVYYGPLSYGGGAVARPAVIQTRITRTV